MLHFLLFNFYTYIQTWMSILLEWILKYKSSNKNKSSTLYANTSLLNTHLESVFWDLMFHASHFISSNLLFRGSHNRIAMPLPMVSIVLLIKCMECFFTLWWCSSNFSTIWVTTKCILDFLPSSNLLQWKLYWFKVVIPFNLIVFYNNWL
jgi:hypothetical protein